MRCHEARQRLKELKGLISNQNSDLELNEHLRGCTACASVARSERALERDFRALAADDNSGDLPLSVLRTRVEAEAASAGYRQKENSLMSAFTNQLKRKPRLSLTLGAAMIVLLIATLIPFKFDQTVGYQVALAGVDRDLAMDSEKIDVLLKELGIQHAVADVSDCQATCRLTISELDSEYDVQVIRAAFDELGNCVLEDVQEVSGQESNTMFGHAKRMAFHVRPADEAGDDHEVREFVLQRLHELSDDSGEFSVFMSKCGSVDDATGDVTIDMVGFGDHKNFHADSIHCPPGCFPGGAGSVIKIDRSSGANTMTLNDKDGHVQVFDLDDPEAIAKINELGLDLDMLTKSGCGSGANIICRKLELIDEDQSDQESAAKESDEPKLPDTYSLAQNYPNPFNPNTTISYRLPKAQQVTLEIYNINGRRVTTLVDGQQSAGEHSVEWNATDDSGASVASGVYFYRLTAGEFSQSKKMSLVK
ncbi:MAG: T9SS type A sorting domain-containing protein [candidate division Zixibacteria bacterium]|nr:T9SS type A sorting domain-containing protein [candidate division Zixibacteria bacterium]MDH3937583.1 T9SS type A sorting domain-containing protein [candidate division Zixibacteria bacterium]MDH4035550.1 T9SS type A sorting domain-containing protein [candidate division Zixibacteria bacterium]